MFSYEKEIIKQTYEKARVGVLAGASFANAQIKDVAVRRALLLGCAAYFIRKAPFLDQAAAEGLSDKALVIAGLILSKLPGTQELAQAKVQQSPVPPPDTQPEVQS